MHDSRGRRQKPTKPPKIKLQKDSACALFYVMGLVNYNEANCGEKFLVYPHQEIGFLGGEDDDMCVLSGGSKLLSEC